MKLKLAGMAGLVWALAAVGAELPPRVAALAPAGAKVISGQFTGVAGTAVASFEAERSIDAVRKVSYHLDLKAFDTSTPIWQMKGPALRRQMEMKMEQKRKGMAPETANMGMFTAEAVKETRKGWGSAFTQRIRQHPPQAKEYVDYTCAYIGMAGGVMWELTVSGLPDSAEEGDRWAEMVAEAASKMTVATIGSK